MKKLGEKLQELREKKGWSKTYVAQRIGLKTMQTYVNYEYNLREPDNETLVRLAELHEVTVDYLLGNSSKPTLTEQDELQISERMKTIIEKVNNLPPEFQDTAEEQISKRLDEFEELLLKLKRKD